MNYQELARGWQTVQGAGGDLLLPITDDESLQRVTRALQELDAAMQREGHPHPLADFSDIVMRRIMAYEAEHYPVDDREVDGPSMLAFMMEQRALTQQQLADAASIPQPVISQLLSGKRNITADHARKLAGYFGCGVEMFL